MPEQTLYEKYPPLPSILWSIDTPKNLRYPKDLFENNNADEQAKKKYQDAKKSFNDNIKKAFRMYVEVISFYDISDFNFNNNSLIQSEWIEALGKQVANSTINDWFDVFSVDLQKWFDDFEIIFRAKLNQSQKQEILTLVPFDCLEEIFDSKLRLLKRRTFGNDFKNLAKRGFLKKTPANQRTSTYSKLSVKEIENKLSHFSSSSDLINELQNIIFDDVLINTSDIFKNTERFFIKFQHIINSDEIARIEEIILELKEKIWDQENKLISISYASSSQKIPVDLIIYPISLFYNQRSIYLAGYGPTPYPNNQSNFYNYRLDHLNKHLNNQYIIPVEWDEDKYRAWKNQNDPKDQLPDIHYELIEKKEQIQQWLSNRIYQELSKALGVDIHRQIKTMLLRFPQDFYEGYIKDTKRHETFTHLQFNNINNFLSQLEKILVQEQRFRNSQTEITEDDKQLIKKIIEANPKDAYYTMNYRHGKEGGYDVEADVIMRLRAWGHNVEVLFPSDLRKRMKEDYQKAWDIYQDKKESSVSS